MSVERRVSEALQATGDYQPSIDLYARLSGSIAETRAHRRRVRWTVAAVCFETLLLAGFLVSVARFGPDGLEGFPSWSLQLAMVFVLLSVLVAMGPTVRRLGTPLIEEVFRMSPETGRAFSRLLDIAYYLFFTGGILNGVRLDDLGATVDVAHLSGPVQAVAAFLTFLGVAHIANLAVLPLLGLIFSAVTRRANRRATGFPAEPASPQARSADRLATAIVMVGVFLLVVVVLAAVVAVVLLGLGS
jgi:hypothetical protein